MKLNLKEVNSIVFFAIKITFQIFDAITIKDKRSVIKSIINRMKGKYNITIAEVENNDIINQGTIGMGIVGNNRFLCQQILQRVVRDIEEQYEVEINELQEYEG